ncbi:hypothetical protein GCK72_005544 [Caenorhabditis remanei]|uniref:RNase H type-1 domain-containing protein n=1 Tax=Caenorhabditis remanei TaxID=31234 RepID=A0A6A5HHU0_CAERE|nr:hypothetical protein GCK72_005544 [Caenorhabditis remanei]KAF1765592.1 hypothetical protein GCK72_005544 [Caenorhabditis remanei]
MLDPRWENDEGTPIVYIFGTSAHEGQQHARAGFGIDWGPKMAFSKGGTAIGDKTELRAELTAVLTVLETPIIIEKADESQIPIFKNAAICSRRVAGMHSTSVEPLFDEHHNDGYRIVDIYGSCNDGQSNALAGYGVYWGDGDVRNECGGVVGLQSSYRAIFTALYRALKTALSASYDEIIIRSCSTDVDRCIKDCRVPMTKNKDIISEVKTALTCFKNVFHVRLPRNNSIKGHQEAEALANCRSGNRSAHISIFGAETSNDGIARYGIFWKHGDQRNGRGWIDGKHGQLCAELTALEIGIKFGLKENYHHLTIYTHSEHFKEFLKNWRNWKENDWFPATGRSIECKKTCNNLNLALDKITIHVGEGPRSCVEEARKLALSIPGFITVRTFGSIQTGNNESVARYAVIWTADPSKDEYGFVDGTLCPIKAKQTGIIRALELAILHNISKLMIETDLIEAEGVDQKFKKKLKVLESQLEKVHYKTHASDEFTRLLETM